MDIGLSKADLTIFALDKVIGVITGADIDEAGVSKELLAYTLVVPVINIGE